MERGGDVVSNTPEQEDKAMHDATELVTLAAANLRDARDLLDEASQLERLPSDVSIAISSFESVVNAIHSLLQTTAEREDGEARGGWSQDSADEIAEAVRRLVLPTPEWEASMARLERHLSSRPSIEEEAE